MPEIDPSATGQIWMNLEERIDCGILSSISDIMEKRSSPRTFARSVPQGNRT
jgi:hypothetical protein